MRYVIEKTRVERRAKRKSDRKAMVPFEKYHKNLHAPEDQLKDRARQKKFSSDFQKDRKYPKKPLTTLKRIKNKKSSFKRHGGDPEHNLKMTTPKAREMEKAYVQREGFVFVSDLMNLHEETSELEKRCVADVMGKSAKGPDGEPVKGARNQLSRAYAICRASLQKSGRIKKGKADLTKKGGKISGAKARLKDHSAKVSRFEKHVVAARKK